MLIDKNILPLVDMDIMNEVHYEDVLIINELSSLLDEYEKNPLEEKFLEINTKYVEWFDHTVNHFRNEEIMMKEKGFFAYDMHKMEHQSALEKMGNIFYSWKSLKDVSALKKYVQIELVDWLVNHIETMDTVTARFLKHGTMGCHASA